MDKEKDYSDENDYNEISKSDLKDHYQKHLQWLESKGTEGEVLDLTDTDLSGEILADMDFSQSNLQQVSFDKAKLHKVKLDSADLAFADFSDVDFGYRAFSLKKVTYFSNNIIHQTAFSFHVKEPWFILQKEYSGAKFLVILIMSLVAFIPDVCEILFIKLQYLLSQNAKITEISPSLGKVAPQYEEVMIWEKLLGVYEMKKAITWDSFLLCFLSTVILIYNGLRAFVTFKVAPLADLSKQSQITPSLRSYKYLFYLHYCILRPLFYVSALCGLWKAYKSLTSLIEIPISL